MVKNKQYIERISADDLEDHKSLHLISCIINTIDFIGATKLQTQLVLEQCIIDDFLIHSCWFINGVTLRNCVIRNHIDYQMGGHNQKPIILEGNVFLEFFNFFDCQFDGMIEIRNNVFTKGTNLLGNQSEGFANSFEAGWSIENNVGAIDLDGVGL